MVDRTSCEEYQQRDQTNVSPVDQKRFTASHIHLRRPRSTTKWDDLWLREYPISNKTKLIVILILTTAIGVIIFQRILG